jgi:hypothetical protein
MLHADLVLQILQTLEHRRELLLIDGQHHFERVAGAFRALAQAMKLVGSRILVHVAARAEHRLQHRREKVARDRTECRIAAMRDRDRHGKARDQRFVAIGGERPREVIGGLGATHPHLLEHRLQILADLRIEFFRARVQQAIEDVEVAHHARLIAQPFEALVHYLGPQGRDVGREQADRRAQSARRDAHLMHRLGLAALSAGNLFDECAKIDRDGAARRRAGRVMRRDREIGRCQKGEFSAPQIMLQAARRWEGTYRAPRRRAIAADASMSAGLRRPPTR